MIAKLLIGHKKKRSSVGNFSFCTPAGARTLDPLIKSQMLYQLSYKRISNCVISELRVQRYGVLFKLPNVYGFFFNKMLFW